MSKLYFRYSAMNAGKSTSLLQVAYNYEEQNRRVRLFTAGVDDRYGVGLITSRLGIQRNAEIFLKETDFEQVLDTESADTLSCVLIDEAQFLTVAQVIQLHRIANLHNIPVICFGIRSDFQGNPFEGSGHLLTLADDLEELKTICSCGRKATMNMRVNDKGRKISHGSQVHIGGNNQYKQVCAKCFYQADARGGTGPL